MIHIRTDYNEGNSNREFACGIKELPDGDTYYFAGESAAYRRADCPKCNPHPEMLGTPISQLSGRPGHDGYENFKDIAASWGYE